jgi:hypothetical protein
MRECEDLDFNLDSSTNTASQPSLVEEPMIRSQDDGRTFAENPASQPADYPNGQVCWVLP